MRLMSKAEYARHRGCDEKAVRKAIKEGRISAIPQPNGRELIDPEVADIQWARNTRARADSARTAPLSEAEAGQGVPAPENAPEGPVAEAAAKAPAYADFRARREAADAEMAEIALAKERRLLVDRKVAEQAAFESFRALRDKAFNVPLRAASRIVGLADVRAIDAVIAEELRLAFSSWESDMLARLPAKED